MKKFKPFEKILYRCQNKIWYPSFYQCSNGKYHFVVGEDEHIEDDDIILYIGNEHLAGIFGEPEEEITLAKGEYIAVSDRLDRLEQGFGTIRKFVNTTKESIVSTSESWVYCIPFSKFNPNNLEETKKWILKVKDGKLVKVNK